MIKTLAATAHNFLPEVQEIVHDIQVPARPRTEARPAPVGQNDRKVVAPALTRPAILRAGFEAHVDDLADSGLLHGGEQWAPQRFMITEHSHPTWEFYLQLHGLTRWRASGQLWVVRPGDLLGVPPQTAHCMTEQAGANIHFMYAALDPIRSSARIDGLAQVWAEQTGVIHLHGVADLLDPFAQLVSELTTTQEHFAAGVRLAVDRITLELTRRLQPTHHSRALGIHPAVHEIQAILDRDFDQPWPLKELADRVSLAPNYLAGLFTAQLGRGPHEYQTERRIARAKQLLATSDLTITAIAMEVGFSSSQHLSRVFRQLTGTTPTAYRNSRPLPALRGR